MRMAGPLSAACRGCPVLRKEGCTSRPYLSSWSLHQQVIAQVDLSQHTKKSACCLPARHTAHMRARTNSAVLGMCVSAHCCRCWTRASAGSLMQAGNVHFAPGRSYQQGSMHVHGRWPGSCAWGCLLPPCILPVNWSALTEAQSMVLSLHGFDIDCANCCDAGFARIWHRLWEPSWCQLCTGSTQARAWSALQPSPAQKLLGVWGSYALAEQTPELCKVAWCAGMSNAKLLGLGVRGWATQSCLGLVCRDEQCKVALCAGMSDRVCLVIYFKQNQQYGRKPDPHNLSHRPLFFSKSNLGMYKGSTMVHFLCHLLGLLEPC